VDANIRIFVQPDQVAAFEYITNEAGIVAIANDFFNYRTGTEHERILFVTCREDMFKSVV
jgi:hypothetical protein